MSDLISRQWLMECVNEGWIKFDTEKDENRFIHLVRDIAPSAQQRKKGKWIKGAEISNRYLEDVYYCSNCHKQAYWDTDYDQQLFDYCPYCGSFNGGQASE